MPILEKNQAVGCSILPLCTQMRTYAVRYSLGRVFAVLRAVTHHTHLFGYVAVDRERVLRFLVLHNVQQLI